MPAKKKQLPMPCPKCGEENGTVQIMIFSTSRNVTCGIAHYDSKKYQNPSTLREKRGRGKKWCRFKMDTSFAEENMPPLEEDMDYLRSGRFGKRKSISYTNPMFLLEAIKEEGWNGKGASYLRTVTKRLGLWEKLLEFPGGRGREESLREFLRQYAPNEKY